MFQKWEKTNALTDESYITYFDQETFSGESKYLNGKLMFFPPVYLKRYEAVYRILQESPWEDSIKKIVDFGCSEMGFFLYLKHIPSIEKILEVDIDRNLLQKYACKAVPLSSDYLFCKRSTPLDVYVLEGSISEYDDYLADTDAVVAIEVIEHLKSDVLDKVPYNIFNDIKPRIAIFTTPNADFNDLFPNKASFRHKDHQFEWSRKEFFNWTRSITQNYPNYCVKLYGIGGGPEGTENLGCCTQMAVFVRQGDSKSESPNPVPTRVHNYKLIRKIDYPYYVDKRTNEEKIVDEVLYWIRFSSDRQFSEDDSDLEIPLSEVLEHVSKWCSSKEQLKMIMIKNGFHIEEKNGGIFWMYSPSAGEVSEIDYEEEEESCEQISEEVDISEATSENSPLEDWDLDAGDENFIKTIVTTAEVRSFLSAHSIPEELPEEIPWTIWKSIAGSELTELNDCEVVLKKEFHASESASAHSPETTPDSLPKHKLPPCQSREFEQRNLRRSKASRNKIVKASEIGSSNRRVLVSSFVKIPEESLNVFPEFSNSNSAENSDWQFSESLGVSALWNPQGGCFQSTDENELNEIMGGEGSEEFMTCNSTSILVHSANNSVHSDISGKTEDTNSESICRDTYSPYNLNIDVDNIVRHYSDTKEKIL